MKLPIIIFSLASLGIAATDSAPAPGAALRQREHIPSLRSGPPQLAPGSPKSSTFASQTVYSTIWAGVVQEGSGFNMVKGTIKVPHVTGAANTAASAWVGIDGPICQIILQTGLVFHSDGSFDAWYEWYPDYSHGYSSIDMHVDDEVEMAVFAFNSTTGMAIIENHTTNQTVYHAFDTPQPALCQRNAEWIVEDFSVGDSQVPFANFGSVVFTEAQARGDDSTGTIGTRGGTPWDLTDSNGKVLTACGPSGDSDAYCIYIG